MKRFRLGLILFASIIIIGQLIVTDYNDLSWSNNAGSYLGIISMIGVIMSMILSNRREKKKKNDYSFMTSELPGIKQFE